MVRKFGGDSGYLQVFIKRVAFEQIKQGQRDIVNYDLTCSVEKGHMNFSHWESHLGLLVMQPFIWQRELLAVFGVLSRNHISTMRSVIPRIWKGRGLRDLRKFFTVYCRGDMHKRAKSVSRIHTLRKCGLKLAWPCCPWQITKKWTCFFNDY